MNDTVSRFLNGLRPVNVLPYLVRPLMGRFGELAIRSVAEFRKNRYETGRLGFFEVWSSFAGRLHLWSKRFTAKDAKENLSPQGAQRAQGNAAKQIQNWFCSSTVLVHQKVPFAGDFGQQQGATSIRFSCGHLRSLRSLR
jgi:hypothetical protein